MKAVVLMATPCPKSLHGKGEKWYQEVRGVTVSLAGERVPPYTVNGWPYTQVLGFPLE